MEVVGTSSVATKYHLVGRDDRFLDSNISSRNWSR